MKNPRPDPRLTTFDQPLQIDGPTGSLEILISYPTATHEPGTWLCIIAHPHPQLGGSLHNKVVATLARSVRELNGTALRFNFRGVGQSQGCYDQGIGEIHDFDTVQQWAIHTFAPKQILLAGFSFGSYIAAAQANHLLKQGKHNLGGLLLIAPPIEHMPFSNLKLNSHHITPLPIWVIQGEKDETVSPRATERWCQKQADTMLYKLTHADHFFHKQLSTLKTTLQSEIFLTHPNFTKNG